MLVAITGRNRAGKTTFANILAKEGGSDNWEIIPFAWPLKKQLMDCGFPYEFLFEKSKEARRLMQAWGDAKRAINPSIFLDEWKKLVESENKNIVSDDLYHQKELKAFMDYNGRGVLVLILRPTLPKLKAEDYEYASVREQRQIEDYLLSTYLEEPFTKVVNMSNDKGVFFVANMFQTAKEYEDYLSTKIMPIILNWLEGEEK